jgi:glucokinase
MSTHPLAIGVDFGGTSIKLGVVRGGEVLDHAPAIATQDYEGPVPLISTLVRAIEDLRQHHPDIAAVGVGMPGFVDFPNGMVYNLTNVRGWTHIYLRDALESATGLATTVENDANCMGYAEWKQGVAVGLEHVVALTLGTGVGGAVIVNGQMVRGANFGAGEVGQTSIDFRGRRGAYGNLGALEDYIGNREIEASAREVYAAAGQERLSSDCSPAELAKAAAAGDPLAIALWRDIAEKLACSIVNICWLLNPQAIVIGGGVAKAGAVLFEPLREFVHSQLGEPFKQNLKILPARFGNEAGMIGAAALAIEQAAVRKR